MVAKRTRGLCRKRFMLTIGEAATCEGVELVTSVGDISMAVPRKANEGSAMAGAVEEPEADGGMVF